jgi:hypothetical protein
MSPVEGQSDFTGTVRLATLTPRFDHQKTLVPVIDILTIYCKIPNIALASAHSHTRHSST